MAKIHRFCRRVTKSQEIATLSFISPPVSKAIKPQLELRNSQLKIVNFLLKNDHHQGYAYSTGLGKTIINVLYIDSKWEIDQAFGKSKSKFLILVPTVALAHQFYTDLKTFRYFHKNELAVLAGLTSKKRQALYTPRTHIYISTPEGLANDLKNQVIPNDFFDILIIDEAHHAVKDYAYTKVAKLIIDSIKKIIAQTATPLDPFRAKKRQEVEKNLQLENWYKVKIEEELSWLYPIDRRPLKLSMDSNWQDIWQQMTDVYNRYYTELYELLIYHFEDQDVLKPTPVFLSFTKISKLKSWIDTFVDNKNFWPRALHRWAAMFKQLHLTHCLFQENFESALDYHHSLIAEITSDNRKFFNSKADERVYCDNLSILAKIKYLQRDILHPKIKALIETLSQYPDKQIIIFENFVQSIFTLQKYLLKTGIPSQFLIGRQHRSIQNQTQANQVIQAFKQGKFRVLIVSPVGFEGLHFPKVNVSIVYSQFKTEFTQAQAEGRIGRTKIDDRIYYILFSQLDFNQFYSNLNGIQKMFIDLEEIPDTCTPLDPYLATTNLPVHKDKFWSKDLINLNKQMIRERFLIQRVKVDFQSKIIHFKLSDKTGFTNADLYLPKLTTIFELDKYIDYYQSLKDKVAIVAGKVTTFTYQDINEHFASLNISCIKMSANQRQNIFFCPSDHVIHSDYLLAS